MHKDATRTTAAPEVHTTPGSPFTVTVSISQSPLLLLTTSTGNGGHFVGSGTTICLKLAGPTPEP